MAVTCRIADKQEERRQLLDRSLLQLKTLVDHGIIEDFEIDK